MSGDNIKRRERPDLGMVQEIFEGAAFDFSVASRDVTHLYINNAETVDLSMIRGYERLKGLDVESDNLRVLDLSPLKESSTLEELTIVCNSVRELDLSPLSEVPELKELTVSALSLERLDLSPLSSVIALDFSLELSSDFELIDLRALERQFDVEQSSRTITLAECRGRTFTPIGLPSDTEAFSVGWCKELASLDLTPLMTCERINHLAFEENALEALDLSPLASPSFNPEFRHLSLKGNHLTSIDLTPLAGLKRLGTLYIQDNDLEHIDLTPLATCSDLLILRLDGNPLVDIDVSPLFNLQFLTWVKLPAQREVSGRMCPRVTASRSLKGLSPKWYRNRTTEGEKWDIEYV
jgi:Leucine-rich repeat (LRR) protein